MGKSIKICYLGDDNLNAAAAYLAGIMAHYGISYDYIRSDTVPSPDFLETEYAAYVLSDYPAKNFSPAHWEFMLRNVENGAGLVMLGGWESFHGRLGEYHESPLVPVLPVEMEKMDDRRNFSQSIFMIPAQKHELHPILADLPWETPPGIGGYNAFWPKEDATVLLEGVRFAMILLKSGEGDELGDFEIVLEDTMPLLVTGTFGSGNVAALATDVAPHWVGGFVDWGQERVIQEIPGAGFVEVGSDYAKFFRNLLLWAARKEN